MRSNSSSNRAHKVVYIGSAMVFGVLVTTLVHALVEMFVIALLVADFEYYGLGLPWSVWYMVHYILSYALLALGIVGGYMTGLRWYRYIYIEKHHGLLARVRKFFAR